MKRCPAWRSFPARPARARSSLDASAEYRTSVESRGGPTRERQRPLPRLLLCLGRCLERCPSSLWQATGMRQERWKEKSTVSELTTRIEALQRRVHEMMVHLDLAGKAREIAALEAESI